MSLLVIAYPEFSPGDLEQIQRFRAVHDRLYYDVVAPHFTLVFPVGNIPEGEFIGEARTKAATTRSFSFVLRYAIINKDAFSPMYHTFLVPDEGNSNFIRLHDVLYRGRLSEHLRLDIDYIPHIGVGNNTDPQVCKQMADEWNATGFNIRGSIHSLTVVSYEQNKVSVLEVIPLR